MPSTAIRDIAYEPKVRELRVTFTSGDRYAYDEVPGEVHRAFLRSGSKGRFFQAAIRGRYAYRKLDS